MTITFNPYFGARCAPHAHKKGFRGSHESRHLFPRVNVAEQETTITLYVFLPGVKKEDTTISVSENRVLTIEGEKKREAMPEGAEFRRKERRFGAFKREFQLPTSVNAETVKASFNDGVLEIVLEKIPQKTTTVEIH